MPGFHPIKQARQSMTLRRGCLALLWITPVVAGCGSPTPVEPTSAPATTEPFVTDSMDQGAETADEPLSEASAATEDPSNPTETAEAPSAVEEDVPSFRDPDLRPRHDAARLAERGIAQYESRRLRLYTDVEPETAQALPPLLDALFEEWERYFGPLPPARDGSDFQLSAYVMRDQQRFRETGLLPENLPVFSHGKHQGQEFWMNDQPHGYYLRHLFLHEATHCFMQAMGGTSIDVPLWYLEGMAELFATHTLDEAGRPTFRVMPAERTEFVGFGRVEMVRQDVERDEALTLTELSSLSGRRFRRRQSAYAWSWAACLLADRDSKYHDRFQELSRRYAAEGFDEVFAEVFGPVADDFETEWTLLTREFAYGFDVERASIDFERGTRPTHQTPEITTSILADRGWQSSGVEVEDQTTYRIETTGRVTLADDPKPWVSEPDGITIRYAEGEPIGRLLGVVVGEPNTPGRSGGDVYSGDFARSRRSVHRAGDGDSLPPRQRLPQRTRRKQGRVFVPHPDDVGGRRRRSIGHCYVTPAKAGVQTERPERRKSGCERGSIAQETRVWMPAFAGMTRGPVRPMHRRERGATCSSWRRSLRPTPN